MAIQLPHVDTIRFKPWRDDPPLPFDMTMLSKEELQMLRWVAKNCYTGMGSVLDCGCFLGGSTIALAEGLKQSKAPVKKLHSFDLFVAGEYEGKAWAKEGLQEGKSFRALYERNIAPYRDLVEIHEGDITQSTIPEGPIEILFIDCAKTTVVNDFFIKLFPRLIPRQSIIIQQDYLYPLLPWFHITMEAFSEYFELLGRTKENSVIYRCIELIPPKIAAGSTWNVLSKTAKHLLMQKAINRWQSPERKLLIDAYASYDIDLDKWIGLPVRAV